MPFHKLVAVPLRLDRTTACSRRRAGAVILAPMCKLGEGMAPGPFMTAVLTALAHLTPKVRPTHRLTALVSRYGDLVNLKSIT